jgi:LacI family transcriptional regulator
MNKGKRKAAATIVDIARRLGISAMTVSRALTGNPEVSEKTRQKVLRCAQELGYRPNRWARSLVTRKTSIVAVVVPDISHSFFAEITRGIEEVVQKAGYNLLLCHSSQNPVKESSEIEMLVESRIEGIIVASEQPEKSAAIFEELRANDIPFVLVDRFFQGHSFPSVLVDDLVVGRLATEHLIKLGHRRIAHIRGPKLSPASLRYRGFMQAVKAHHLEIHKEWIVRGNFDIPSGREAMQRLLNTFPRPTAVFAANDPMAIGALHACRETGVQVPADISIVGAGNIEGMDHPNPFLTTIDWPRQELGRTAANYLIEAIRNPPTAKASALCRVFSPCLLIRQSTRPPAGK